MERESHFAKNSLKAIAGTMLGLSLAVGATSKDSGCATEIKWQGSWHYDKRDSIAICANKEGRVVVVGRDSPVRILPEDATLEWTLSGIDGQIFWLTENPDNYNRIYRMDLDSGKIEKIYEYYRTKYNPYGAQRGS